MTRPSRHRATAIALLAGAGIVLAACGGAGATELGAVADGPFVGAPVDDTADPPRDGSPRADDDAPVDGEPVDGAPSGPATTGDCSASGATVEVRSSPGLPDEVAAMRDLLLDAALRCDEQLLRTAIDGSTMFTYTFGTPGDAIGAWWELEAAGEQPFLRIAELLATTPALADGGEVYVWPRVHTGRPQDTSDAAWAELGWLDGPAVAAAKRDGHLDWRLGISVDGEWRFFVRGD